MPDGFYSVRRHSFSRSLNVSLPVIPSAPRTLGRCLPLDCRFRRSFVACQYIDSSQVMCTQWPTRRIRSFMSYAPGVGAPDQRFLLLPPPHSRAGLVLHMAQAMSTTQTTRLPRAVSMGSTSFRSSHLATPTRTSLVSFEPLLPLLTSLFTSLLVLRFHDLTVAPRELWPVPDSFRTVVLGRRFVGFVELMGGVQLVDSADDLYCGRFPEKRFCVVFPWWLRIGFLPRSRRRWLVEGI